MGRADVVRILIEHGAPVNKTNKVSELYLHKEKRIIAAFCLGEPPTIIVMNVFIVAIYSCYNIRS